MKRFLAALSLVTLLTACDMFPNDPQKEARYRAGQPVLVSKSFDDVNLWVVLGPNGRPIYYSAKGTQYQEQQGKSTITIQVPNTLDDVSPVPNASPDCH